MPLITAPATASVLIVDDDTDSATALASILEYKGYRAATASNGKVAMEYLRAHELPSLIILDMFMPEMDGWEFRRRQKENPRLANVPVVVVTAFGRETKVDADEVLSKPVELDRLLKIIPRFVSHSMQGTDGRGPS